MPTYVYHCDNCGKQFELFQHYTDDSLTVCPDCGYNLKTAELRLFDRKLWGTHRPDPCPRLEQLNSDRPIYHSAKMPRMV